MKSFKDKVLSVVARIPKGKIFTYKQVARLAGNPKAARAVGTILSRNYDPRIPCHRVVRSDGKIGGYNRGARNKLKKLKEEGVVMSSRPRSSRRAGEGSRLSEIWRDSSSRYARLGMTK